MCTSSAGYKKKIQRDHEYNRPLFSFFSFFNSSRPLKAPFPNFAAHTQPVGAGLARREARREKEAQRQKGPFCCRWAVVARGLFLLLFSDVRCCFSVRKTHPVINSLVIYLLQTYYLFEDVSSFVRLFRQVRPGLVHIHPFLCFRIRKLIFCVF